MVKAPAYVSDGIGVLAAFVAEVTETSPIGQNSAEEWQCGPFTLRDFCWCDGDTHEGGRCPPNFEYRNGRGLEVSWYKYLGRGTETSRRVSAREWATILTGCLQAVADGSPTRPA